MLVFFTVAILAQAPMRVVLGIVSDPSELGSLEFMQSLVRGVLKNTGLVKVNLQGPITWKLSNDPLAPVEAGSQSLRPVKTGDRVVVYATISQGHRTYAHQLRIHFHVGAPYYQVAFLCTVCGKIPLHTAQQNATWIGSTIRRKLEYLQEGCKWCFPRECPICNKPQEVGKDGKCYCPDHKKAPPAVRHSNIPSWS
jgi:hypothetical protein